MGYQVVLFTSDECGHCVEFRSKKLSALTTLLSQFKVQFVDVHLKRFADLNAGYMKTAFPGLPGDILKYIRFFPTLVLITGDGKYVPYGETRKDANGTFWYPSGVQQFSEDWLVKMGIPKRSTTKTKSEPTTTAPVLTQTATPPSTQAPAGVVYQAPQVLPSGKIVYLSRRY